MLRLLLGHMKKLIQTQRMGPESRNDVPFIHLGSENLVLCFSLKIEMFNSGPGDENCQRHGSWFKKERKKESSFGTDSANQ